MKKDVKNEKENIQSEEEVKLVEFKKDTYLLNILEKVLYIFKLPYIYIFTFLFFVVFNLNSHIITFGTIQEKLFQIGESLTKSTIFLVFLLPIIVVINKEIFEKKFRKNENEKIETKKMMIEEIIIQLIHTFFYMLIPFILILIYTNIFLFKKGEMGFPIVRYIYNLLPVITFVTLVNILLNELLGKLNIFIRILILELIVFILLTGVNYILYKNAFNFMKTFAKIYVSDFLYIGNILINLVLFALVFLIFFLRKNVQLEK